MLDPFQLGNPEETCYQWEGGMICVLFLPILVPTTRSLGVTIPVCPQFITIVNEGRLQDGDGTRSWAYVTSFSNYDSWPSGSPKSTSGI